MEAGRSNGRRPTWQKAGSPKTSLAVEIIFPTWLRVQCFARFADERPQPQTRIGGCTRSVLSGTEEMLLQRKVDLAVLLTSAAGLRRRFR